MNKRQSKKFRKRGYVKKYHTAIIHEMQLTCYFIESHRRANGIPVDPKLMDESQKLMMKKIVSEQNKAFKKAIKKFK